MPKIKIISTIINITNEISNSKIEFIPIHNTSVVSHVCFVLFIVCLYICVCECLLQNNNHKTKYKDTTTSGSAFEPGGSGLPYRCTTICVRSWCTWRASCVAKQKQKKTKTNPLGTPYAGGDRKVGFHHPREWMIGMHFLSLVLAARHRLRACANGCIVVSSILFPAALRTVSPLECAPIHIYMCICVYACMCACARACVCMCTCTCRCYLRGCGCECIKTMVCKSCCPFVVLSSVYPAGANMSH